MAILLLIAAALFLGMAAAGVKAPDRRPELSWGWLGTFCYVLAVLLPALLA